MLTFLIFSFFLILPFQWALSPMPGIDLAFIRVASLLLFFSWIAEGLTSKRLILPPPLPFFLFSLFLFIAALSSLWAIDANFSVRKIIFLFTFLPLFFVLVSFFTSHPEKREPVLKYFTLGAVLSAFVGCTQFALQFFLGVEKTFALWTVDILPFFLGSSFGTAVATYPSLLVNISGETLMRASAFFPDPHMFSFYVGIATPLAFVFFLLAPPSSRRVWFSFFLLLVLADLLSFSRGGYLGLLAGTLVFLGSYFQEELLSQRRKVLMVGALVVFVSLSFFTPWGERLTSSFSLKDGSNVERLRLWKESVTFIAQKPLLGVGIGNYPLLVKPSAAPREPIYAHNLYIDIALETGLLGLFSFLGILILGLALAWRKWKKEKDLIALALLASLVVFAVHAFFETPLFSVHVLPALLLILSASVL